MLLAGTQDLTNADCGIRNVEFFKWGMRNLSIVECGMDGRGEPVCSPGERRANWQQGKTNMFSVIRKNIRSVKRNLTQIKITKQ